MTRESRILAVTAAAGFVAVCVFFVMVVAVRKRDRADECAVNLRHISMAMGSPHDARWDTLPTGRAFWAAYPQWPAKDTRPLSPAMFVCPAKGGSQVGRDIDYRGPRASFRALEPTDTVACDQHGNHGHGLHNVLLKNGALLPATLDSEGWRRALATTAD